MRRVGVEPPGPGVNLGDYWFERCSYAKLQLQMQSRGSEIEKLIEQEKSRTPHALLTLLGAADAVGAKMLTHGDEIQAIRASHSSPLSDASLLSRLGCDDTLRKVSEARPDDVRALQSAGVTDSRAILRSLEYQDTADACGLVRSIHGTGLSGLADLVEALELNLPLYVCSGDGCGYLTCLTDPNGERVSLFYGRRKCWKPVGGKSQHAVSGANPFKMCYKHPQLCPSDKREMMVALLARLRAAYPEAKVWKV